MNDLIVPLWFILFAIGFPVVIGLWTKRNNTYGDAVRLSGLATLIIGTLIVIVAIPFMSFGQASYLTTDARGDVVRGSEYLRLLDTASSETLTYVMISLLLPLLLIGLITTKLTSRYPRLSAGLLWALAVWLLGWQETMLSSASTFMVAVPIMAIVTAVFGTLAFREHKQRELRLRYSGSPAG